MRGRLTDAVQEEARKHLKQDISQPELRLMPYIQYCVMNDQDIDPARINQQERMVLSDWREMGLMTGGASNLQITRKFWDAMSAILWEAYIDHD